MADEPAPGRRAFRVFTSVGFPQWLASEEISIALSTYQLGKLFLVGVQQSGKLGVFERTFNRCMGLCATGDELWLAAAYQIWRLSKRTLSLQDRNAGFDRLYVPSQEWITGDVDAHDLGLDEAGMPIFVNTRFSCLATVSTTASFDPIWRPPFITRLAAEDRCHLNGMAIGPNGPEFVTACAETDAASQWREYRERGGCVIDVASGETVVGGLSMPHSPRLHRERLWLLDSGNGYLGVVDPQRGTFQRVAFCPGYARGLTFHGDYALIGLSKPRQRTFAGLPLDDALRQHNAEPLCGLQVVDLRSGETVQWLRIEGRAEELYDVAVIPGVRRAKAIGLKNDDVRTNVWVREGDRLIRWSAKERAAPDAEQ